MNVGCLKILMARVANTSLFKRIRVFSNFCVFSNLLKRQMNRRISLELNPWGPHPSLNWRWKKSSSCVYFHALQTASRKKISRRGRARQRNLPSSELHVQNFLFNFLNLLLFDVVVLVAIAVVLAKATQFYRPDVCKLLGIRMRFFVWGLY